MKPTTIDLQSAILQMGTLKFFPAESTTRAVIMDLLSRIVSTESQLEWLVRTLIDHIGEWPGPAQMRALYATRFRPADGIEGPHCTLGGFTPAESETRFLEDAGRHKLLDAGTPTLPGSRTALKRLQ